MIFQQDGCVPHRAHSISSFLEAEDITLLQWPAQSPDLNIIENAWAMLKRELRRNSTYPPSKDSLFNRLSEIWDSLPTSYCEKLIASMSSTVKEVQSAKGLSTKY